MKRSAPRSVALAVFVLLAASVAGGLLGDRAQADSRKPTEHMRTFSEVLALVESEYVREVDSKELIENAIRGMLRTLDPHTNYLPPEAYSEMKDEQRGRFSGLGIQIAKRGPDKPLTVIAPIDGTPAHRAGLRAGDVIAKIEGEETITLAVQDAVRKLKGPRGTPVTITIKRPGDGSQFDVTIVRDLIPIDSIGVATMLQPGIGYVQIGNFTTTTTHELDQAVEDLQAQGMDRLLLDLRNNPGGLLEQAVKVAERFVPSGDLIVYTRGRIDGSDQEYYADNEVERVRLPLVVLVDRGSASASEIVSGAIQDHDLGLVVGETTFGKGLVQRVIPLRNNGALAVTTAKYYTPSGRLIQRDYSDTDEYFLNRSYGFDGEEGEDGEAGPDVEVEPRTDGEPDADPDAKAKEDRTVHFTASGREVYGGGGITPDYVVPSEPLPILVGRMLRENMIFDFGLRYSADHPDLEPGFEVTDDMMSEYREFLGDREFEYEVAEFDEHRDAIALRILARISRLRWDIGEERRILSRGDAQIQKALTVFDEAADLAKRTREPPSQREKSRIADLRTPAATAGSQD